MEQLGHVADVLVEARAGEAGDETDLLARVDQVACRLARGAEGDVENEQQPDRQGQGELLRDWMPRRGSLERRSSDTAGETR
jgi:hypothetical protein